mmetsp:Transcript_47072/g.93706  ORF Transcript_47072/g.93706 Transcript_47072/m.93706 type:complete len:274 (-) Transcript_47072:38-859(-)
MATEDGGSLRKLNERENLVVGTASGVLEQVVLQPLLYWKNARQQGLAFTLNPKLLYRGTFASASNLGIVTGLQCVLSGSFQKLIVGDAPKMSISQEVGCGFLGGVASAPVCCILELIMIQQQRFGGSLPSAVHRILQTHGPLMLMRGFTCTASREGLFTAGYLGLIPAAQSACRDYEVSPWWGNCAGSIGGGLFVAAVTQPLDTAKTCMQGDLERTRYGNVLQTLRSLRIEYGSFRALYKGYSWRAANLVADFFLLDWLVQTLSPVMFPARFA